MFPFDGGHQATGTLLAKSEMAKIPVFGYIYPTVVMVDRTDAEHRARSVQVMKSVLRRGCRFLFFRKARSTWAIHP
jgi:hypothetical protein